MTDTSTDDPQAVDAAVDAAPAAVDEGERHLELMPVHALVPALKNPKTHDIKTLRQSLKRFGFVESPAIDERTGRLVAGHGRVETLRDLEAAKDKPPKGVVIGDDGRWMVHVQRGWASVDDDEAAAYVVTSNRLVELGGWDDPLLDEVLADVAESPLGLDGVGFEPPAEEVPTTKVENLTPLRWSHALVSYQTDLHDQVGPLIEEIEKIAGVRVRATVNDAKA